MLRREMTLLEIVEKYPATQEVFRAYEAQAGHCFLFNDLFATLEKVCEQYGLDLKHVEHELKQAANKA